MAELIPSDALIRAMDGPALTLVAHQLGLAPAHSMICESLSGSLGVVMFTPTAVVRWEPHVDIDQASAVLRQMREYRWWTIAEGGHDAGEVSLEYGHWEVDGHMTFCCAWHPHGQETEPLAILRACVLARAQQQRAGQEKE